MSIRTRNILIGAGLLLPVVLAILGARLENNPCLFAELAIIAGIVVLVSTTGYIPTKLYPLALFSIGLALLYQTTLVSPYLVGTDIHPEYYYYRESMNGWNPSTPGQYNLSIALTVIAPAIHKALHIDGYWIFKAIYPFVCAFTPVFLYFGFKELMGSRRSFIACFFFVAIPTYMMELIGIAKLQLAAPLLAMLVFLLLYKRWSGLLRLSLACVVSIALVLVHYSTGYIYIYFLIAMVLGVMVGKLLKLGKPSLSMWIHGGILALSVGVLLLYFMLSGTDTQLSHLDIDIGGLFTTASESLIRQEPAIHAAIGSDILSVPIDGVIFRVLQLLTEVTLVVGFLVILWRTWRKHRYPLEYAVLCVAAMALLAACVIFPVFSRLLNMTRFYFLALYVLAPAFVIGGEWLLHRARIKRLAMPVLVCGLLIPYCAFTSGAVFELEQQPDIASTNIPYSIALSHQRIDIAAITTQSDHDLLEWAMSQEDTPPIFGDVHGRLYCMEWLGPKAEEEHLVKDLTVEPDWIWIYLTERNEQTQTLTFTDLMLLGTRQSYTYEELGVADLLDGRPLLYQVGDAKIYGAKGE